MILSIITICFNNRQGLEATLSSVFEKQPGFADFEEIVIDGGSTDGSVDVIKSYADRLAYWVSEPDGGIYAAMNKGIKRARGEYLLFLNSGDVLYDGVLSVVFNEQPKGGVICGNVQITAKGSSWIIKPFAGEASSVGGLILYNVPHQGAFIRREMFERYGLYNETYRIISDWAFWLDMMRGGAVFVPVDVTIASMQPEGISATDTATIYHEFHQKLAETFDEGLATMHTRAYAFQQVLYGREAQILESPACADALMRWCHCFFFFRRHRLTRWLTEWVSVALRLRAKA